jgi:hypothetical protein
MAVQAVRQLAVLTKQERLEQALAQVMAAVVVVAVAAHKVILLLTRALGHLTVLVEMAVLA